MSVLRHRFVYSALFIVLAASAGRTQTAPTPFRGVPIRLPGTIEVEDFDDGGEGIAYHDLTPSNEGGAYRATDVDLQPTSDAGGGYNLGWVNAGEWLTYTRSSSGSRHWALAATFISR